MQGAKCGRGAAEKRRVEGKNEQLCAMEPAQLQFAVVSKLLVNTYD